MPHVPVTIVADDQIDNKQQNEPTLESEMLKKMQVEEVA